MQPSSVSGRTSSLPIIPQWAENGHSRVPQIIAELNSALDQMILNAAMTRTALDLPVFSDGLERRLFHLLNELPAECEKLGFDSLTGFPTLNAFRRALERHLCQDRRHEEQHPTQPSRSTICVLIDIDKLKLHNNINDFAGDAAICSLADVCRSMIRGGDILARTRGDQFGLLLPDTSLDLGVTIATRILEGARKTTGLALPLRCSIGLAGSTIHGYTPQTVELAAISALSCAKSQGRDRLCVALESRQAATAPSS